MDGCRDQREMDGDYLSHTTLTSQYAIMETWIKFKELQDCVEVHKREPVSDLCLGGQ